MLPFVAVGLFYRHGYFRQTIDADGHQEHAYPDYELSRLPLGRAVGPDGELCAVEAPPYGVGEFVLFQHKVALDGPVNKYVPHIKDERITVRQVLQHTSGLPEYVLEIGVPKIACVLSTCRSIPWISRATGMPRRSCPRRCSPSARCPGWRGTGPMSDGWRPPRTRSSTR